MKIAVFDSGLGGLSVLHQAMKVLEKEDFLYFADEEHVPYGSKTKEEIIGYVDSAIAFMIEKGAKAVVLACNTATSMAVAEMREKYALPIIGMEPAVKLALDGNLGGKSLVIATPVTIGGTKLRDLLASLGGEESVDLIALPKLVDFAEKEDFSSEAVMNYLKEALADLELGEYKSIVLGCTHFNYFKDSLRKLFGEDCRFFDGNAGTIRKLQKDLEEASLLEEQESPSLDYFYSEEPVLEAEELEKIARYLERLDAMLEIQ